jgi:tetratricopeptide (TPR) repeat protein
MSVLSVELLCQKARQAFEQRDPERARQYYRKALELKSDSPDVHYGLAAVCFQMRDLPGAAHHFREVTRLDPLRAGAFINLGAVYNLLEAFDDAVNALRRAIQLDPQRGEAYYNLGLVYKRKGQLELALQAYREALRVDPRMADAHYNLANLFLERGQYGQAFAHYKHALALRPNWAKAMDGLQQAETALRAEKEADTPETPDEPLSDDPTDLAAIAARLDAELVLNPNVHGDILHLLHRATIDSESHGRSFLQVVESDLEPVIKELSSCLLQPSTTAHELNECIVRFEAAMSAMREAQKTLQGTVQKIRNLGTRFAPQRKQK